jgi:hypothetical protein
MVFVLGRFGVTVGIVANRGLVVVLLQQGFFCCNKSRLKTVGNAGV